MKKNVRNCAVAMVLVVLIATPADGADPQNELFDAWAKAQANLTSLVVEFTLKLEPPVGEATMSKGVFRLLRTDNGELFASYNVQPAERGKNDAWPIGLLNNGAVYLLDSKKQLANQFDPDDGDMRRFLTQYFNPFVRLLDRRYAAQTCQIEIVKQDQWYTYLMVKTTDKLQIGRNDALRMGRIVLMNKDTDEIPKYMPRQFWYDSGSRHTIEIKSWRLNSADPPKIEEFTRPEDRLGWTVHRMPWSKKKN